MPATTQPNKIVQHIGGVSPTICGLLLFVHKISQLGISHLEVLRKLCDVICFLCLSGVQSTCIWNVVLPFSFSYRFFLKSIWFAKL